MRGRFSKGGVGPTVSLTCLYSWWHILTSFVLTGSTHIFVLTGGTHIFVLTGGTHIFVLMVVTSLYSLVVLTSLHEGKYSRPCVNGCRRSQRRSAAALIGSRTRSARAPAPRDTGSNSSCPPPHSRCTHTRSAYRSARKHAPVEGTIFFEGNGFVEAFLTSPNSVQGGCASRVMHCGMEVRPAPTPEMTSLEQEPEATHTDTQSPTRIHYARIFPTAKPLNTSHAHPHSYTHTHTRTHTHTDASRHSTKCAHMCAHTQACKFADSHTHAQVPTYMHALTRTLPTHLCTCTPTHKHTHTHHDPHASTLPTHARTHTT